VEEVAIIAAISSKRNATERQMTHGAVNVSSMNAATVCTPPGDCGKETIRPGFSGSVPIFNDVFRKNHGTPWTPVSPFFGLVSRICPDMFISAAVCLRIGDPKLAQIYLYIRKKSLATRGLTTLPTPQVGPPTARACGARTQRFVPSAIVPYRGAQIMVTLEYRF